MLHILTAACDCLQEKAENLAQELDAAREEATSLRDTVDQLTQQLTHAQEDAAQVQV